MCGVTEIQVHNPTGCAVLCSIDFLAWLDSLLVDLNNYIQYPGVFFFDYEDEKLKLFCQDEQLKDIRNSNELLMEDYSKLFEPDKLENESLVAALAGGQPGGV